LHYLSKSLTDNGEAFDKFVASWDGKQLRYIDEIMETFAYNIEKTKPNVLIISGDLTINGEKQSHLDLAQKLKAIENSGTSIYVVPGNHDILNPYARGFKDSKQYVTDYINAEDFSKIYADFGYNEAVSRDKASLSYLAAPSEEVWLLMLDTNKYKDNIKLKAPQLEGELSEETLNWVKKCGDLAKQKGASIVSVMHHNILDHSEVIREGFTLDNNEEALKVFEENNINLVLSGHIHIQDICADNSSAPELYDIASNSLPIYPHQYGILNYSSQNKSLDYNTRKLDVEAWSKEKGIVDQNLNNFNKYSEDYFGKFAYDMAAKQFSGDSRYSEREIKLMSETMRLLNLRYFAGTENLNSKDVLVSEGFKLWSDSKESFLKRYAMNIFSDKNTEDNSLHIKLNNGETKAYIK
jgi:3',5'-cyclic AMP phosphodiesterase CpdA